MEKIEKKEKTKELAGRLVEFLSESVAEEKLPTADAIFVFGHYDPRPALQAAKLWKSGKAPKIILSGRGRDKIPQGFETEADFYASLIEKEGIPSSTLILEKESTNTLENVLLGIAAGKRGGFRPKSLILCALPPLLRRSIATFQKQFPDISVCGSAFAMPVDEFLAPPRLKRIIGEFDRLRNYAEKGDIAPVEIPNSVQQAIDKLRTLNGR